MGGGAKPQEFIYIKFCIHFYMFKLDSPSRYSSSDAMHLLRHFFHCSKQFLNSSILMPFSASAIFCSTYSTLAKRFSLSTFSYGETTTKKVTWGEIGWIGSVGHGVHVIFGQKLMNTQCGVGKCACKSPTIKWANVLEKSFKKSAEGKLSMPAGALIQMGF